MEEEPEKKEEETVEELLKEPEEEPEEPQKNETSQSKKSKKTFYIILLLAVIVIAIIYKPYLTGNIIEGDITGNVAENVENTQENIISNMENTQVKLTTNHGDIVIELYGDMPITTGNFKNLAEKETYNGVIFHRIIDGFMIQGGDPTGTGMGDPSIPNIQDEFTHEGGNNNKRGTISMANAGPNTGSSQFFINLIDNNFLDSKHPAFGEVTQGMDIVDKIAKVQVGAGDKPVEDVIIEKAEVL